MLICSTSYVLYEIGGDFVTVGSEYLGYADEYSQPLPESDSPSYLPLTY